MGNAPPERIPSLFVAGLKSDIRLSAPWGCYPLGLAAPPVWPSCKSLDPPLAHSHKANDDNRSWFDHGLRIRRLTDPGNQADPSLRQRRRRCDESRECWLPINELIWPLIRSLILNCFSCISTTDKTNSGYLDTLLLLQTIVSNYPVFFWRIFVQPTIARRVSICKQYFVPNSESVAP